MTVPMPGRIERLPRDRVGRPVPWFVAWVDGKPDFRIVKPGAPGQALRERLCWICGIQFLRQEDRAFVIGPMCAVNRVSAEPPAHRDCGIYSAVECPFLATPNMVRRDRHLPEGTSEPPGVMIRRNPGVALVWVTRYRAWRETTDAEGGRLFDIGEPRETLWFARGREATRSEALQSIYSGMPLLQEMAEAQGPDAVAQLDVTYRRAMELVPA